MQPSDSAAIVNLISDTDGDMTTRFLVDAYAAIVAGTEFQTIGVVAEQPGVDGIIGIGTVRLSETQFNGDILPMAFLDGLKVRQDFRAQGLGYAIADWRVQYARQIFGDNAVIATGMAQENLASRAVAKKWSAEFIEPAFQALVLPTRQRPPSMLKGVTVREIEPSDFEAFAAKQNKFYQDYNFYRPNNPGLIEHALAISIEGKKPYRFFIATDASGNLLAGAQMWARGGLKTDTLNHLPLSLSILNKALKLIPPDHTFRDIAISGLWHEPGQIRAARLLFDTIRWEMRTQATLVTLGFDLRDPVRQVVALRPWHQPRPLVTIAVCAPRPINRDKLLFVTGRV